MNFRRGWEKIQTSENSLLTPGFELESQCLFPTIITITPRTTHTHTHTHTLSLSLSLAAPLYLSLSLSLSLSLPPSLSLSLYIYIEREREKEICKRPITAQFHPLNYLKTTLFLGKYLSAAGVGHSCINNSFALQKKKKKKRTKKNNSWIHT